MGHDPWAVVILVFTCLVGLLLLCLFSYKRSKRTTGMASNVCVEPNGEEIKALPIEKASELQIDQGFQGPPWIPGGKPRLHHPLYKKMSNKNGQVNVLPHDKVKESLSEVKLSTSGSDEILRKRLKSHLRRELIQSDPTAPSDLVAQTTLNPYGLDYLCVLDFEATCLEKNPPDFIHEIIEFPVLLLNLQTLNVEAEFHTYCKPVLNPVLSDFCKKLTGIRQAQVDKAPSFSEVFRMFLAWMEEKELGSKFKFAVLTDCPWDIKECLFPQCVFARVPFPKYASKWIDVRKLFASFYQIRSGNLSKMLQQLGMKFEGREHCGLHDTRNITRIIVQMITDGCILKYNRFMPDDALRQFSSYR